MKMTKKIVAVCAVLSLLVLPMVVSAQITEDDLFGEFQANDIGLGDRALPETIASVINTILGLLGILAVVLILWAGFLWMTAAGIDDKIKQAKGIMTAGVIGLAIIFSAYAIAQFVLTKLISATTG
mgnify:CR=1 FL=1